MERLTILKKSEHCRDHGAAQSAKILETAFVSEWAMNFIKPLATPRKHNPASFKVTINNHTISPEDNLKYLCPS